MEAKIGRRIIFRLLLMLMTQKLLRPVTNAIEISIKFISEVMKCVYCFVYTI